MLELKDKHTKQTAYIIGKGNSINNLKRKHFGNGIVICLNESIQFIENLKLRNLIYSMQKDGATPHIRDRCPCDGKCSYSMVKPKDAILLLHEHESKYCFPDYEKRIIFDAEKLGLYMFVESVVCAIELSKYMGCNYIKMIGFDSYTSGDNSNILGQVEESYPLQRNRINEALKNIKHEFVIL